jgi:hypothetical protein
MSPRPQLPDAHANPFLPSIRMSISLPNYCPLNLRSLCGLVATRQIPDSQLSGTGHLGELFVP